MGNRCPVGRRSGDRCGHRSGPFKESIIRWLRHPELTARLEARHPDCVKTPLKHGEWWGSRYFLRLWIRNEGDVRAEKVEVFLCESVGGT